MLFLRGRVWSIGKTLQRVRRFFVVSAGSTQLRSFVCAFAGKEKLEASHRIKIAKAQVKFLATSWILRGTWDTNEDQYLVEMNLSRKGSSFLAHLVGRYPNECALLASEELRSEVATILRVSLDASCDISVGQMALQTAPDDLIPTQLIEFRIQPKLRIIMPPEASCRAIEPWGGEWVAAEKSNL